MKRVYKRVLSMLLICTLMISSWSFLTFAGEDVTGKLLNFDVSVEQNGEEITESDVIDSTSPIDVEFSFQVPVIGDGTDDYVNQGDTASFLIASGFTLTSSVNPLATRWGKCWYAHNY